MKELSIEEKAKAYDKAIERANELNYVSDKDSLQRKTVEHIFPQLKESEDERIKKALITFFQRFPYENIDVAGTNVKEAIAWLEKQGDQTSANKIEPKFKVKYAGSEYNVFETKDIAGVTFYGIEDEPNHIDYVKADNCEIISGGYGIKENGSPYPTKPAVFSEQKPAWSEGDENRFNNLIFLVECSEENDATKEGFIRFINKLKSLKPQNRWKPSEGQMSALSKAIAFVFDSNSDVKHSLESLYNELKKL